MKFLGIGDAFSKKYYNNSAYKEYYDTLVFFDCGETTFHRIKQENIIDETKRIVICITHNHPDHIGSLGSLIFYCYYAFNIIPEIIGDKDLELILKLQGVTPGYFRIYDKLEVENLGKISRIEVPHTITLRAYSIVIENFNGEKIYYMGDLNTVPAWLIDDIENGITNEVYIETTHNEAIGNVHLTLNDLMKAIPVNHRHKVYCMHLNDLLNVDDILKLGFNVVKEV